MNIKNMIFTLALFLFVSMLTFSTENRVQALTGQGAQGAALVADSWCDPFYISPSLATLYDRTILFTDDSFSFNFNYYRVSTAREVPTNNFDTTFNHRAGLFLPINRFRLGFSYSLNLLNSYFFTENSERSDNYNIMELYLGGSFLFAVQLNRAISFGFLLSGGSLAYDIHLENYAGYRLDAGGSPIEVTRTTQKDYLKLFNLKENVGFTINKKRFTTSLALPFSFNYSERQNALDRYNFNGDYDYLKIDYIFEGGLHSLSEFRVKESFGIRFSAAFKVKGNSYSKAYNRDSKNPTLFIGESFDYWSISFNNRVDLTFNHYFRDKKHLLFYGVAFDSQTYSGKGEETTVGLYYKLESDINLINLTLHFGGEMKPHERVSILFGLNAQIFRYQNLKLVNYNSKNSFYLSALASDTLSLSSSYYADFKVLKIDSPLNVDISFGIEIYPLEGFTIELNTALLNFSPRYYLNSVGDYQTNDIGVQAKFDLGFVWDITELNSKKTN